MKQVFFSFQNSLVKKEIQNVKMILLKIVTTVHIDQNQTRKIS